MKTTAFSVGRQYRCERTDRSRDRESFNFVIIGKGFNSNHKLCLCWVAPEDRRQNGPMSMRRGTAVYSHNHLKKYGEPLAEVVDPLAFEVNGTKYRLEVEATKGYGGYKMRLHAESGVIAEGDATFFDEPIGHGQRREKVRLSTGTIVEHPHQEHWKFQGEVSFDLEFYAWKAWLKDVLGEDVTLPFFEK